MSLTWRRSRITGAGLVAAQYDLTLERQTTMDNILFIPGIANPAAEIRQLLFGQGQPGLAALPTYSQAMIAANSFGSGVEDILDLSGNNNPFSQATPSSRGAWFREPKSGARNIIGRPSDDLATWNFQNISGTASVVGNSVVFGASVSDRLQITDMSITAGVQYTISTTLSGSGTLRLIFLDGAGSAIATTNITLTTTPTRYTVTGTAVGSGSSGGMQIRNGAGGLPSSFTFINAQYEIGPTATNYQRRGATAFDVTEAGKRDCYGVRLDAIDDFYQTGNINMSGASAITMFAAVRKRSNVGFILEHSPNGFPTTSGVVALTQETQYRSLSRRPDLVSATVSTGFAPPVVSILTGKIRSNVLNELWVDNVLVATNTDDQGADPFLNAPLNLGRRSNNTNFLDGDVFGVIFVEGDVPQATFQRVNRILSRITPTVNL
jgi:hypothetical protein